MLIGFDQGSIFDSEGKLLFCSIDRFIQDIANGECCFICGKHPSEVMFNDEHVLPDWILKRYQLHNKVITLPNGTTFEYDNYKVPCCSSCNTLMGTQFEQPIAGAVAGGLAGVRDYVSENGSSNLYLWLNLIFLKTHLKDRHLRLHRNLQQPDTKIADAYTWEELHHIYTVARSFYSGAALDTRAFGTFIMLPAKVGEYIEEFDFADFYPSRTILLRLGDTAFISNLNDAGTTTRILGPFLNGINGPLSPLQ